MVGENTNARSPLLPDRYPIDDFFICDVTEAMPKDDIGSMEHPVFSLSTKPDTRIRVYEHNGVKVAVAPSAYGLATIHDKDVLIYCISQLVAKMNAGDPPSKTLHLKAHDLLIATNRKTDGRAYEQLEAALDRLSGTRIKTNLRYNDQREREGFGLIDSWKILTREDLNRMEGIEPTRSANPGDELDRMAQLKIVLSDWVLNAVLGKEVLTLHRNYFRLRRPIERRMYELARKHCGMQSRWRVSLELLQKKCGSNSSLKEFRRMVGEIVTQDSRHQHFPDYSVGLEDDMVTFAARSIRAMQQDKTEVSLLPALAPETYDRARLAAPGWDVYALEQEWRGWGVKPPRDADEAFVGFCRHRFLKQGTV